MAFLPIRFFSAALNVNTSVHVVLPDPQADSLPPRVLYLLHGYGDDQSTWMRQTSVERHVHPYPVTVIGAYARGKFEGDLTALTEPGFGDLIAPYMLENSAIPADFWERTAHCERDCAACGYCGEVYEQIRRKQ